MFESPIIALDSFYAIANVGSAWSDVWKALLNNAPIFDDVRCVFDDLPSGPPVAIVKDWQNSVPTLHKRGQELVFQASRGLRPFLNNTFLKYPKLRMQAVIATSHAESGAVSEFAAAAGTSYMYSMEKNLLDTLLHEDFSDSVANGIGRILPTSTMAAACASGVVATGFAKDQIESGMCDACLVIAADAISRIAYTGFKQLGVMSVRGCRPFEFDRDGTTVGEGAAAFVLCNKKFDISCDQIQILSSRTHCDAKHPVEPNPEGIAETIQASMLEASLSKRDISAIIWHGTGTHQNDTAEAEAAKIVFGTSCPPSTATKGVLGHTMGASGAFNLMAACEARKTLLLPPSTSKNSGFPWLNLSESAREIKPGPILVVALGFGGINSALIVK